MGVDESLNVCPVNIVSAHRQPDRKSRMRLTISIVNLGCMAGIDFQHPAQGPKSASASVNLAHLCQKFTAFGLVPRGIKGNVEAIRQPGQEISRGCAGVQVEIEIVHIPLDRQQNSLKCTQVLYHKASVINVWQMIQKQAAICEKLAQHRITLKEVW